MAGIPCSVTLKSAQTMGKEAETTTEVYSGNYMDRLEKRYLSYKRVTAEGETAVLINFTQDFMSLTQQGQISSHMEFKPGEKTFNDYGTPAGKMTLAVFTKSFSVDQQKDYIKIVLKYDLLLGNGDPITTDMDILVKF